MGYGYDILTITKNFIFLLELFFFLYLAKWVYDKVTGFSFHTELTERDNLAFSITLMGYLVGVAIVLIGVNSGDIMEARMMAGGPDNVKDIPFLFFIQLSDIAVYSMLGIVLLLLSRVIGDRFILPKFSMYKEIIDDKNSGTGVVLFASFVSTALIINASITGEGGGVVSCIFFFLVGQFILILFSKLYQAITPFDIHEEIEKDNVAVGCSFAGTLLAAGILIAKGITGEFTGMMDLFLSLLIYTGLGFVLFPLARIGFDKFFIPGVSLSKELVKDQNIGLGVLEGTIAIILASAIYYTI